MSWLARILERMKPAPAEMSEEDKQWLRDTARQGVRAGYDDRDAVITEVRELSETFAESDFDPVGAVDAAIAELRTEMETWPVVTQYDRLRAALDRLDEQNVLIRENFWCCGACASSDMPSEIAAARAEGRTVEGYLYFHEQDVESVVEGGSLWIAYGAPEPTRKSAGDIEVGHRVVDALRQEGLDPIWNGKVRDRIEVAVDWKRRDVAALASPERVG